MQAASDIMLGWIRTTEWIDGVNRDFYVRQLWDGKGSAPVDVLDPTPSAATASCAAGRSRVLTHAPATRSRSAAISAPATRSTRRWPRSPSVRRSERARLRHPAGRGGRRSADRRHRPLIGPPPSRRRRATSLRSAPLWRCSRSSTRPGSKSSPGIELHVRTAGSGTPVVLLHGYPQSGLCWHRVAPALAERHTVVVPDLRGYGRSSTPPDDDEHTVYSKRRMAADVVAVMSALGHERFAVVGHDRGGRVAYRTALDHPERVERLCTLDIVPTIEQFEILASSRRDAVFGFHWYFLAVAAPVARGADRRRAAAVPGAGHGQVVRHGAGRGGDHGRGDGHVRRRLHPCGDRRIVRRLPGRGHVRQRPRRRRSNGRADHRLSGPRAVGRSTQRRRPTRPSSATWRRWTATDQPVTGRPMPCGHFIPEEQPEMCTEELLAFLR